MELVLASPKGGEPPLDPRSTEESYQTADTRRFAADAAAQAQIAATLRLAAESEVFPYLFNNPRSCPAGSEPGPGLLR